MSSVAPEIPLPYIGDTPLDVIIFVGTAIYYRLYQWRRDSCDALSRQEGKPPCSHREQDNNLVHRAKTIEGYKDSGLYEFMDKCVERKRHLRKVGDPELARREKMKRISAESKSKLTGNLGLSPEKLLLERQRLQPAKQ
jgi:hypothetical protein